LASKSKEYDRLTQYILSGLSERERERLEAEYFEDDDAFEQMLVAEEELTDAYVCGELSVEERVRFEKSYLSSPRGCERVQFARALAGAVSDARATETAGVADEPERSLFTAVRAWGAAWRFAFAAAALVAVVSLIWMLVERARMQDELRQLRSERAALNERAQEAEQRAAAEQARSGELLAQLEGERARPTPGTTPREENAAPPTQPPPGKSNKQVPRPLVASFVLTPGLVRGGGATMIHVPRNASSIALWLKVEADTYQSYRAVIEAADGRRVWSANVDKPRRVPDFKRPLPRPGDDTADLPPPFIILEPGHQSDKRGTIALPSLRARDLPPGDYILLLSGKHSDGTFEGVADYSFRVVRK
jgi:hypothetical protein